MMVGRVLVGLDVVRSDDLRPLRLAMVCRAFSAAARVVASPITGIAAGACSVGMAGIPMLGCWNVGMVGGAGMVGIGVNVGICVDGLDMGGPPAPMDAADATRPERFAT
jgi:hypothetical protein